jgi:hypothetical protein
MHIFLDKVAHVIERLGEALKPMVSRVRFSGSVSLKKIPRSTQHGPHTTHPRTFAPCEVDAGYTDVRPLGT